MKKHILRIIGTAAMAVLLMAAVGVAHSNQSWSPVDGTVYQRVPNGAAIHGQTNRRLAMAEPDSYNHDNYGAAAS